MPIHFDARTNYRKLISQLSKVLIEFSYPKNEFYLTFDEYYDRVLTLYCNSLESMLSCGNPHATIGYELQRFEFTSENEKHKTVYVQWNVSLLKEQTRSFHERALLTVDFKSRNTILIPNRLPPIDSLIPYDQARWQELCNHNSDLPQLIASNDRLFYINDNQVVHVQPHLRDTSINISNNCNGRWMQQARDVLNKWMKFMQIRERDVYVSYRTGLLEIDVKKKINDCRLCNRSHNFGDKYEIMYDETGISTRCYEEYPTYIPTFKRIRDERIVYTTENGELYRERVFNTIDLASYSKQDQPHLPDYTYAEINTRYLNTGLIDEINRRSGSNSIIVWSMCGTGKTTMLRSYIGKCIRNNQKVLYITGRISLCDDVYNELIKDGINAKHYRNKPNKCSAMVCCINSVRKVTQFQQWDVVIIDECNSVYLSLIDTLKKDNDREYWHNLIKSASSFVALDGTMTRYAADYYQALRPDIAIVRNYYKSYNNTRPHVIQQGDVTIYSQQPVNALARFYEGTGDQIPQFIEHMLELQVFNQKTMIPCDQANVAIEMHRILREKFPNKDIRLFWRESGRIEDKEKLLQEADIIIYSPTFQYGVDFNSIEWTRVVAVLMHQYSYNCLDQLQLLLRNRQTDQMHIFTKQNKRSRRVSKPGYKRHLEKCISNAPVNSSNNNWTIPFQLEDMTYEMQIAVIQEAAVSHLKCASHNNREQYLKSLLIEHGFEFHTNQYLCKKETDIEWKPRKTKQQLLITSVRNYNEEDMHIPINRKIRDRLDLFHIKMSDCTKQLCERIVSDKEMNHIVCIAHTFRQFRSLMNQYNDTYESHDAYATSQVKRDEDFVKPFAVRVYWKILSSYIRLSSQVFNPYNIDSTVLSRELTDEESALHEYALMNHYGFDKWKQFRLVPPAGIRQDEINRNPKRYRRYQLSDVYRHFLSCIGTVMGMKSLKRRRLYQGQTSELRITTKKVDDDVLARIELALVYMIKNEMKIDAQFVSQLLSSYMRKSLVYSSATNINGTINDLINVVAAISS